MDVISNGNHLFLAKLANPCIKYPLKTNSSVLVWIGINKRARIKNPKNLEGLKIKTKFSGLLKYNNKVETIINNAQVEKEKKTLFQSTFGRDVVKDFKDCLCKK